MGGMTWEIQWKNCIVEGEKDKSVECVHDDVLRKMDKTVKS